MTKLEPQATSASRGPKTSCLLGDVRELLGCCSGTEHRRDDKVKLVKTYPQLIIQSELILKHLLKLYNPENQNTIHKAMTC